VIRNRGKILRPVTCLTDPEGVEIPVPFHPAAIVGNKTMPPAAAEQDIRVQFNGKRGGQVKNRQEERTV